MPSPVDQHRSYCGSDDSAKTGRRRQPAETLRAIVRVAGVGDISLNDSDRPAAESLYDARDQEQPERARVREYDVSDRGDEQSREERGPTAVAIRKSSPNRSAGELRDRERGDQNADDRRRRAHFCGVERKQRDDHRQAQHVNEGGDHEDRQLPFHSISASPAPLQHLQQSRAIGPRSCPSCAAVCGAADK